VLKFSSSSSSSEANNPTQTTSLDIVQQRIHNTMMMDAHAGTGARGGAGGDTSTSTATATATATTTASASGSGVPGIGGSPGTPLVALPVDVMTTLRVAGWHVALVWQLQERQRGEWRARLPSAGGYYSDAEGLHVPQWPAGGDTSVGDAAPPALPHGDCGGGWTALDGEERGRAHRLLAPRVTAASGCWVAALASDAACDDDGFEYGSEWDTEDWSPVRAVAFLASSSSNVRRRRWYAVVRPSASLRAVDRKSVV